MSIKPTFAKSNNGLYTVRMYDYFEPGWFDIATNLTEEKAIERWNKETNNGTKNACFDHKDYYAIFPADTQMLYRTEDVDPWK